LWDTARRRSLESEESFLKVAVTGYYGAQARQAAEAYNAAWATLTSTPRQLGVEEWKDFQYPVYRVERRVEVQARLRLIEAPAGRLVWASDALAATAADHDTRIEPNPDRGVEGKSPKLVAASHLKATAVSELESQFPNEARILLASRATAFFDSAGKKAGDEAVEAYVRYLFDCVADPDPQSVDLAVERLYSPPLEKDQQARVKEIVIERLGLRLEEDRPGATAQTTPPGAPAPVEPGPPSAPEPAEPPQVERPARVFRGVVSRDDDRYPKELMTIDGIVVKVKDTDEDPLDADMEIRVGDNERRYEDQKVGARIRGRGLSGRSYVVLILKIHDDTETVYFSVEALTQ
jgi:hypothetical protein